MKDVIKKVRHLAGDQLAVATNLLPGEPRWHGLAGQRVRAHAYVGTDANSGDAQFDILVREGLRPTSYVLEIGCGALHAGVPLMRYLEPDRYVGIDPNAWLRDAQLRTWTIRRLASEKRPRFLTRDDFDASQLGVQFDYVLAHSILSHAAHWQLEPFFRKAAGVLAPTGRILVSIRLAEGNEYGSPGSPDKQDSHHPEWVYPGVSWFRFATVEAAAAAAGLKVEREPQHTATLTARRPNEIHDWLRATHGNATEP